MSDLLQAESTSGAAAVLGNFGPTIDNQTVFYNYTERALAGQFIQVPLLAGNNYFEVGLFELVIPGLNATPEQANDFDSSEFTCPSSVSVEYRDMAGLPVWRYIYNGIVRVLFHVLLGV